MRVVVVPHDPRWAAAFDRESRLVAGALGANAVAVHHIGSTAIPGIHAKPIIDLLVAVNDLGGVDDHTSSMTGSSPPDSMACLTTSASAGVPCFMT